GEGSGVIYKSDGYIITNYHVIEGAINSAKSSIAVYLPSDASTSIPATVVGYSISSDLAVVKINATGLPAIELADSDELSVGEYAIAIGNPGGLEFMGSVTFGIISGLNRTLTVEGIGEMSLIQTDAAINPGNSGGALVNSKGELIGINSNKLVSTSYEGMGFAIPSNTVVDICNSIIANENTPTPYVGIVLSTTYDAATLKYLGYPAGAVVQSVAEGSPAHECGIRRGDIITEFGGEEIESYQAFSNIVNQSKPGDIVTVQFYRSGRYYSTSLAIGANNAQ
ncbi:MAG: trypsin-like peptidase domain-containing protein, partial [Clostridia bacterium]|nr:trypsin-like peptidase domain-containing protein [Clostridia bacterium]